MLVESVELASLHPLNASENTSKMLKIPAFAPNKVGRFLISFIVITLSVSKIPKLRIGFIPNSVNEKFILSGIIPYNSILTYYSKKVKGMFIFFFFLK